MIKGTLHKYTSVSSIDDDSYTSYYYVINGFVISDYSWHRLVSHTKEYVSDYQYEKKTIYSPNHSYEPFELSVDDLQNNNDYRFNLLADHIPIALACGGNYTEGLEKYKPNTIAKLVEYGLFTSEFNKDGSKKIINTSKILTFFKNIFKNI